MGTRKLIGDFRQLKGRGRNGYFVIDSVYVGEYNETEGFCQIESKKSGYAPPIILQGNKDKLITMLEEAVEGLKGKGGYAIC